LWVQDVDQHGPGGHRTGPSSLVQERDRLLAQAHETIVEDLTPVWVEK